jgi:hypothetical protein
VAGRNSIFTWDLYTISGESDFYRPDRFSAERQITAI